MASADKQLERQVSEAAIASKPHDHLKEDTPSTLFHVPHEEVTPKHNMNGSSTLS